MSFFQKFWYVTRGKHKVLARMLALFITSSILEMLGTGLIGPFAALITDSKAIESNQWLANLYSLLNFDSQFKFVIFFGLCVIFTFYLKATMSFIAQKSVAQFAYALKGGLSLKLIRAYLEAPYTYHLSRNSANLVQSVVTSTDQFCIGLVLSLLTAISNSIVVVALVTLLVWTNAAASISIAVLLVLSFIFLKPLKMRLARWGKTGYDSSAEMIRILNHGIGGLKETRVIGCETYFENQMREASESYATNLGLASGYANLPRYIVEVLMISFLVVFAFIFTSFNQGNEQNLSSIFGIFAIASIRLLPATGNTISCINVIRYNSHSLDQLFFELSELEKLRNRLSKKLLKSESKWPSISRKDKLIFDKEITIQNISYSYPNSSQKALNKLSLNIKKGQAIGLIGKSGSGKTTLVDVLMGLLLPQEGDITVDNLSIYKDLNAWQHMIGYVPQSIFLIDDTLERNIAFGVPDHLIDHNRIQKAIQAAQLSEVIKQLPEGLKTSVGERGVLLSGGQCQRVGIARALYHQREILVFDEATAALDQETESLVSEATKALSGQKTIIIIAHRLSTIEHCDLIFKLEEGKISNSGSYEAVVLNKL